MDYVIKALRFGDRLLVRYRLCPFPTDGLMKIYPYSASLEKQFKESEPEVHMGGDIFTALDCIII